MILRAGTSHDSLRMPFAPREGANATRKIRVAITHDLGRATYELIENRKLHQSY